MAFSTLCRTMMLSAGRLAGVSVSDVSGRLRQASAAAPLWGRVAVAGGGGESRRREWGSYTGRIAVKAAGTSDKRAVRPSKTAAKHEAQQYLDVARALVKQLTDKQTARLEPLIGAEAVTGANLARTLQRSARGRQEKMVAAHLREMVKFEQLGALQDAVASIRQGQEGVAVTDPEAARQAELYLEGLLEGRQEAMSEVVGLARQVADERLDVQRLLQLARQAAQARAQAAEAAAAAAATSSAGAGEQQAGDGAGAGASCVEQQQAQAAAKKAAKVRRELRKMLLELAVAARGLEAGSGDEDEQP